MRELPLQIKRAIRKYEKIERDGLTLYPILVKEYDEYLLALPALTVMHQSLPVAMMRIPLLSALYQMDYEAAFNGQTPTGLFSRALLALALSLRLGEGKEIGERLRMFRMEVDREKPEKLICVHFTDGDGEDKKILPSQYRELRQIIAAQNGAKLHGDNENPELVQAEKDMAEITGANIEFSVDALVSAVSALSHTSESEINEWPILQLEMRSQSYLRILQYVVCGVGEMSGTKWNGGNPVPHPFFAKAAKGTGGLISMRSLQTNVLSPAAEQPNNP